MTDRRMIRLGLQTVVYAALLAALAGCGGDSKGENALDGPAEVMAVYKANCVNCHGSELQGRIGQATNLQEVGARMTADELRAQIEEGGETMPPFKDKLTPEEIAGLAEWLSGKK